MAFCLKQIGCFLIQRYFLNPLPPVIFHQQMTVGIVCLHIKSVVNVQRQALRFDHGRIPCIFHCKIRRNRFVSLDCLGFIVFHPARHQYADDIIL